MFLPPFNLELVGFLASHRTDNLTKFFLLVSSLGTFPVYSFIIVSIYVAWNKKLAIRLAILLVLTQAFNRILKLVVRNPRPFVNEGTYLDKWAVSAKEAEEIAAEFSTPSGHAMSAAAFYSYLFAFTRNRYVRILAVLAVVLIGVSRPYLGVHYFEDIVLGWAIGLSCALLFIRFEAPVGGAWSRLSFPLQVGIAVAGSMTLSLLTFALSGFHVSDWFIEVLSNTGFLTGIIIARPLELRIVNFDPRSSHLPARILRLLFTFVLVLCAEEIPVEGFAFITDKVAPLGYILTYFRFAAAGFVCIFLAPFLFTKLGLAKTTLAHAD